MNDPTTIVSATASVVMPASHSVARPAMEFLPIDGGQRMRDAESLFVRT
jgi:hypothetical protein